MSHSRAFTIGSFHFRLAAVFYWCYDVMVFRRYCHFHPSFPSIARSNRWRTDEDEDPTSSTKSFVEFDQVATLWLVFSSLKLNRPLFNNFDELFFTLHAPYTFWKVLLVRESYSFLSFFYKPKAVKKRELDYRESWANNEKLIREIVAMFDLADFVLIISPFKSLGTVNMLVLKLEKMNLMKT